MALALDPSAMLPLTRAMDRFAGSLELIGKSMGRFQGPAASGPGFASSALQRTVGNLMNRMPPAAGGMPRMAPKMDMRQNSLLDEAMGVGGATAASAPTMPKVPMVQKALADLAATASKATGALVRFGTVTGAASATLALGKKIPILGNLANTGQKFFGMQLDKLSAGFKTALLPLDLFAKKVDFAGTIAEQIGRVQSRYSDAISNSSKAVQDATGGLVASFNDAMSNPLKGIPDLAAKIRPFVEAFNPHVVQQFDDALRSVYAVIGEALVPVMKMAAEVTRTFAGYLRPVMKQLEPVFAQISKSIGGFLGEIMPQFGLIIKDMVPYLQRFLDALKDTAEQWPETARAELAYRLKIGTYLETWTAMITDLLRKIPLIGGWFGKFDGQKLKVNAEKENIFSFGAPTNPQFKAAETLGRDTLQAAYGAMPGFEQKKDELGVLQDIEKNTREQVGLMGQMIAGLAKPISDTVRAASSVQEGAKVYDERVQGGGIIGGAQWAAGQTVEGVYNFGVGIGNLFTGKSWSEGMVDI